MKYKPGDTYKARNEDQYHRVKGLISQFDKYEEYYRRQMVRLVQNQRMMWGIDFGQWPSYVVEKLIAQGRRPPTFNIIGKKIEFQVGYYLSNGFEVKYTPENGRIDSLVLKARKLYVSDQNRMRWKTTRRIVLRDFFNMVGYERMLISDRYSEQGNIDWEPMFPNHVYLDTSWKSHDVEDINNYFEFGWFFPSEICSMFPDSAEYLKGAKLKEETTGVDLGEYSGGVQPYEDTNQKWGDRHKLISFHYVKKEERWFEYDIKNQCMFPETGFEPQSQEDMEVKRQYIEMMGLDPNRDITLRKQKKRKKYLIVICPSLNGEVVLANGLDRIQTNNCNIYPIGNGFNGQFKGITDELYDVNIGFNKGRMNIDDIQQRSAKGAFLLDKALTGGDVALQEQIEKGWSDPAFRGWVDEGSTAELGPSGGMIEFPSHPPSADLFRTTDQYLDYADWFSNVPAAMDARMEGAQESGKLYQSKFQVGLLGMKFGMELWEAHEHAKAAAYIRQIKLTYSGWPREFPMVGDEEPVQINQRKTVLDENTGYAERVVIDDISMLPEMLVSLEPAKTGTTIRQEMMSQYSEMIPLMKQDPENRLGLLVIMDQIVGTSDNMDDEAKEELKMAFHVMKTNAALQQAVLNSKLQLELMRMQAMMQQSAGGPGGPGGPGGQGQEESVPQQISGGGQGVDEEQAMAGTPEQQITGGEEVPIGGVR